MKSERVEDNSQNLDKLPEDALALIAYAFTHGVHGFSPCTSIEVRLDDPMGNIIGQGIGLVAHWTAERKYIEHYGHQDWAVVHKDDADWKALPQGELIQKAHEIMDKLKFKLELGRENIYVQEKSKWVPLKQINKNKATLKFDVETGSDKLHAQTKAKMKEIEEWILRNPTAREGLHKWARSQLCLKAPQGMEETTVGEGGYLVPHEYSDEAITILKNASLARRYATTSLKLTCNGKVIKEIDNGTI